MIDAYEVEDVRAAERRVMATVPDGALMQRAAAALAVTVARELRSRRGRVVGARVVLLVGPGDNGGDALWAGARLAGRGVRVDAVLVADRAHEAGLQALRAAGGRVTHLADVPDDVLTRADAVLAGVLDDGGLPGVDEAVTARWALVPEHALRVAVDLPSGADVASGARPAAVLEADLTVTFGSAKPSLLLPPASTAAGRVEVVDIGTRPALVCTPPAVTRLDAADLAAAWPVPRAATDKYRRGVLGVVAGGRQYTGAAVLATGAAVQAGVGMVRYVGPPEPTEQVRSRWPEVVPGGGRVQAWVLGRGVDPAAVEGQADAIREALASGLPCLVDAGALSLLPERVEGQVLLTPHAGELATLLTARAGRAVAREQVEAAPLRHAREAAALTGATVLIKGGTTLVVPVAGTVRSQADGPPWLATAGSGDVLAGLTGTLLAAGLTPLDAGAVGAAVHGRAGARASGGGPVSAESVLHAIPATVAGLLHADDAEMRPAVHRGRVR
ncbi:bifunctional ADP-dependent NAD(P)H-hydrate dehydratase/NAD(P)H-hydrate epimerase [Angustibacter aerolatus]